MDRKEILLIALIAVLVLTTAVQAVQLVALSSNPVVVAGAGSSVQAATGASPGVSAPSSLDNLPSMVGGC